MARKRNRSPEDGEQPEVETLDAPPDSAAAEPPSSSVSVGGVPPFDMTEPVLSINEFARVAGGPGTAGFLAYARAQNLEKRSLAGWREAMVAHMQRPVR